MSAARLVGLGAALLVNPMLVLLPHPPAGRGALGLGVGVGVLTVLVLWRIDRLVTDREGARRQLVEQVAQRDAPAGALQHAATHDALTGLPNRAVLIDELTAALSRPTAPAVLFLDLDGFKPVNDRLGHAAGDALLVGVAGRLRACLREGDLAARVGGDEFALLVHGDPDRHGTALGGQEPDQATVVADRVVAALGAPFALTAGTVTVGVSIGMTSRTTTNEDGDRETAEQLLHEADQAMYTAKRAGKGRYHTVGILA